MRSDRYGEIKDLKQTLNYNRDLNINLSQKNGRNRWIISVYLRLLNQNHNNFEYVLILMDNYCNIYRYLLQNNSGTKCISVYDSTYKCVKELHLLVSNSFSIDDDFVIRYELNDDEIDYMYEAINNLSIRTSDLVTHFRKVDTFINEFINKRRDSFSSPYNSIVDLWVGHIEYDNNELIIYYDDKPRDNLEVWGSWNKWLSGYKLIKGESLTFDNNYCWFISFPNMDDFDDEDDYIDKQMPKYGKYHYKLKKNGEWIEPTENDLREKDKNGNWNFVLFIHS